mmetsp:Transcript_30022/g.26515  ORF Transcript_30022/g.26515 Transcript_30022/m.26515 type:complete len:200 (+) Transcript_30022:68-667(+)
MQKLYSVLITLVYLTECTISGCYTPKIKEAIEDIISSWYLAQINFVLNDQIEVDEFNSIIDTVFDCGDYRGIDICIDFINTPEPCDIAKYDSCDEVKDRFFDTWADVNTGITFGKMLFECGKNADEIIVMVTKTYYSTEGNNFNLDVFTLARIADESNELSNWRVNSWQIGAKRIDLPVSDLQTGRYQRNRDSYYSDSY